MENNRTKLYIAYGSNLHIKQMTSRCHTARVAGSDVLEGYRLLFRGYDSRAFATIEPFEGGKVPVLIWAVGDDDEAALDLYEGFPELYRKETLTIQLGGENQEAFVYIMNTLDAKGYVKPLARPSDGYFRTVLEGYRHAAVLGKVGFDENILHEALSYTKNHSGDGMSDVIKSQILAIRDSGKTNMLDTNAVQRLAYEREFYELVDYLTEHKKAYAQFILTGGAGYDFEV